jgi:signal transduction histidine kinase
LVSHELRAPLTNIQAGLEVVLDGVEEAETNESLELIMAETSRLGGFVETILDLSALESGRFPIHLRSLSLPEIVKDVCSKFSTQAGGKRIIVNLADNLPPVVADDQGVQSILYHLLDNAIKYAPEGEIHLNAIVQDERVILSICDSGPGIPEDERENVFEMFYRLDSSDSREIYGRGLGLNLARRFLDVMGGGIEITDSESSGTEVRFWLPIETNTI